MRTIKSFLLVMLPLFVGCSAGQYTSGTSFIQAGSEKMPHASRPTEDRWTLVYHVNVRFPVRFQHVPQVQLAMTSIEAYSRKPGTFYRLEAKDVSTSGFDLNIYGAYMESFSNCAVAWTAIE